MGKISRARIIGIDVSHDWLDITFCQKASARGCRTRLKVTSKSLNSLLNWALRFASRLQAGRNGGCGSTLDTAGIVARQLPPAQIKAFATSWGTRAKTDRIDAELIARFMMFRPDAGRVLTHEKLRLLRALTSKRGQLVETHKRLLAQIKAHAKLGSADMFDAMNAELKDLLDRQIAELEERIEETIATDDELGATVGFLRSVHRIGTVTSTMLIPEMPELGQLSGEQDAALAGLAPVAHDSGAMRGKRAIGGGRRLLRHVMFQAALVASHHNSILKTFADRRRAAGKPYKVVITAVARKLVTIANALCKSRLKWTNQAV